MLLLPVSSWVPHFSSSAFAFSFDYQKITGLLFCERKYLFMTLIKTGRPALFRGTVGIDTGTADHIGVLQ